MVGGVFAVLVMKNKASGTTASAVAGTEASAETARVTGDPTLGEELRFGDLGVTVNRARVESYGSMTSVGQLLLHEPALVVRIGIKNHNANRVVEAGSQSDSATLADDVGNRYDRIVARSQIGLPTRVPGQIPPGSVLRVRSDEREEDVLLFDRPVPGASVLTLTLDGSRYGSSGKVKVTIPLRASVKVKVQANRAWQDSGIDLIAGSRVTINPDGAWKKGEAACPWTGFWRDKDPKLTLLRRLQEEHRRAMEEHVGYVRELLAIGKIHKILEPTKRPKESQADFERRVQEYEKQKRLNAELSQRSGELKRLQDEAQKKVSDSATRVRVEEEQIASRRLMGKANLMCLLARIGPKGNVQTIEGNAPFEAREAGHLFFQANDLDLQENSGSLDVVIHVER
jgi:hypothetical protein